MSDSYRRRLDETVIYLPTNVETLLDIVSELRLEYGTIPARFMTVTSDDDDNLVIGVPLTRAWENTATTKASCA